MATLREQLERPDAFVTVAELVTSRGLLSAESGQALQARSRELAANPRIDVLSITDNPGGNAMLAPDTLGNDLLSLGQEVIIHLACKDWNRNALESRGWKMEVQERDAQGRPSRLRATWQGIELRLAVTQWM